MADLLDQAIADTGGGNGDLLDSAIAESPRPVRNNNPLNIKATPTSTTLPGVAGLDPVPAKDGGNFLRFDNPESGFAAADNILGRKYANWTLDAALRKWSNNGYGAEILPGIDPNRTYASLSPAEKQTVVQTMAHREGFPATGLPSPKPTTEQGGDLLDQAIKETKGDLLDQAMAETETPSLGRRVAATAARVALPIGGFLIGGPPGAVAGGALGETVGEKIEGEELDPTRIGISAALGLIPAGRVGRVLEEIPGVSPLLAKGAGGVLEGLGITTGAKAVESTIKTGTPELPTKGELVTGGLVGGVAGVGGHYLEGRVQERAGVETPAETTGTTTTKGDLLDQAIAETTPGELPPAGSIAQTEVGSGQRGFRKLEPTGEVPPIEPPPPEWTPEKIRNLFRDESPEVQDTIVGVAERNKDLMDKQTRGVQSDERRQALADLLIPEGKLPSGRAVNAEEGTALVNTADAIGNRVDQIKAELRDNPDDPHLLAELQLRTDDLGTMMINLRGARAEAGRTLRAFRFAGRQAEFGPALARESRATTAISLEKAGARSETGEVLTGSKIFALLERTKTPEEELNLVRELKANAGEPLSERVQRAFFSSILSRPITSLRNFTGNAFKVVTRPITSALAHGVASREAQITGEPATSSIRDISAKGYAVGLQEGWRKLSEVWRRGYITPTNPEEWRHLIEGAASGKLPSGSELTSAVFGPYDAAKWRELATHPLAAFGQGVRRILGGTDAFFRSINEEASRWEGAYARARIDGIKKGLTGEALVQHINDQAPVFRNSAELVPEVKQLGARGVYQETPGELARKVMSFKDGSPLWKGVVNQIIPFVKTPANITRQGMNMLLGPVFSEFVEGRIASAGLKGIAAQRARQQAVAEGVLGTILATPLVYLASKGLIHGDVPEDPKDKAQFYASGRKPNSIDIGGKNVSLQLFGPVLPVASSIANVMATAKTSQDVLHGIGAMIPKTSGAILSQSFLDGLSSLYEAVFDHQATGLTAGQRFEQFAGSRAASFIPGVVQDIAAATDQGVIRQPQTFGEEFETALPKLRENVPPRVDVTGFPADRPGLIGVGPLGTVLKDITPIVSSPLKDELDRLNDTKRTGKNLGTPGAKPEPSVGISSPPRNTTVNLYKGVDVTLQGDNDTAYREAVARLANRLMTNRVESDNYQRMSDTQKRAILEKDASLAGDVIRNIAKGQILRAKHLGQEYNLTVENLLPRNEKGLFKPTEAETAGRAAETVPTSVRGNIPPTLRLGAEAKDELVNTLVSHGVRREDAEKSAQIIIDAQAHRLPGPQEAPNEAP